MGKLTKNAIVAFACLILGVSAACGGSTPTAEQAPPTIPPEPAATDMPTDVPPTATLEPTATITPIPVVMKDVLGIWSTPGSYIVFGEDGVMRAAASRRLLDNQDWFGEDEFTLKANTISFKGIAGICSGLEGQWQISITADGQLEFDRIDEECPERRDGLGQSAYTFIQPLGTPEPPNVGTLTQTSGSECTFEPDEGPFHAGEVGITIVASNVGSFNLWRLAEGYTYEEFRTIIETEGQNPNDILAALRQLEAKPNSTTTVYESLQPGIYAFVCLERIGGVDEPSVPAGPFEIEE